MFLREVIPWWLAPIGYGGLAILSIIFIPMVYTPVKWYYVAVAYLVTPLFALPNSYGAGLTDWDCASMYGKLALFVFAAWAGAEVRRSQRGSTQLWQQAVVPQVGQAGKQGPPRHSRRSTAVRCRGLPAKSCASSLTRLRPPHTTPACPPRPDLLLANKTQGNGVIVGLAICGVVLSATSSAATLMGDFRTSYICLAAPRAMFAAQLVGQLLGAVLTPMCFMLFFQTGQVRPLGFRV